MENAKRNKIIIAVVAVLSLLLIVWLITKNLNQSNTITENEQTILSLDQARSKSDSLYQNLKNELSIYKVENEELYAKLSEKEAELEKQYEKINRLIRQAQRDGMAEKELEQKLQKLTAEVEALRMYVEVQLDELIELEEENKRLKSEKNQLSQDLDSERQRNESISNENESLKSEKSELEGKVEKASVLKVINVEAQALKAKAGGEDLRPVKTAKKAEVLKVCFDIIPNTIVPSGPNKFYLRIIDPTGSPLIVESKGSGRFVSQSNQREIYFTTMKNLNYTTNVSFLCMEWKKTAATPFLNGNYSFEIYNRGYHVGTAMLELK